MREQRGREEEKDNGVRRRNERDIKEEGTNDTLGSCRRGSTEKK